MSKPAQPADPLLGPILQLVGAAVGHHFDMCQLSEECGRYSLGVRCMDCGRACCLSHFYMTASAPPKAICVSCIVGKHPELFEDPDDGVIEAEFIRS